MLTKSMLVKDVVLKVKKYRGEAKDFVGKVVEVRDTHESTVSRETRRAHVKTRSRFLVTLERVGPAPKGEEGAQFKKYYHAFCEAEVVA